MLIDWFTVIAQALNFLILVWLLRRFLYKPILNAIDEREKKIAAQLADAESKKSEAQKERDEFQHKNETFDQQRAELLSKARAEAKEERDKLINEARKESRALSAKHMETVRNDAHNLSKSITRRTQTEVFAIARKTLEELASVSLEELMIKAFIRRLKEMNAAEKDKLGEAIKSSADPALVRSTFDLSEKQRSLLQNALNELFSADIHLRFETEPDLISGIELTTTGNKVAWSISDYLSSMEKCVGDLLDEQVKLKPSSESKTVLVPSSEGKPDEQRA